MSECKEDIARKSEDRAGLEGKTSRSAAELMQSHLPSSTKSLLHGSEMRLRPLITGCS